MSFVYGPAKIGTRLGLDFFLKRSGPPEPVAENRFGLQPGEADRGAVEVERSGKPSGRFIRRTACRGATSCFGFRCGACPCPSALSRGQGQAEQINFNGARSRPAGFSDGRLLAEQPLVLSLKRSRTGPGRSEAWGRSGLRPFWLGGKKGTLSGESFFSTGMVPFLPFCFAFEFGGGRHRPPFFLGGRCLPELSLIAWF